MNFEEKDINLLSKYCLNQLRRGRPESLTSRIRKLFDTNDRLNTNDVLILLYQKYKLEVSRHTVQTILSRLTEQDILIRTGHGIYALSLKEQQL